MNILKAFNPHELPADTVLSLVTGRHNPIQKLLNTVRSNLDAPVKQHVIVSAPRGYGKSFFLRYLQIKIEEIATREHLPIAMALLPEELPHVRQPDTLLTEIKRTFQKEAANTIKLHWSDNDGDAWDEAVAELDSAITRHFGKRRGLLIAGIENFDILIKKILGKDIQAARFRELITRYDNRVMIVAASARGSIDKEYNKPLFKAFDEIVLEPWSTDEVLSFFEAQRNSAGKKALTDTQKAKARAVATFIGGTPRLATLIGDALLDNDPVRAADLLDRLVDELTPYYKERIEALPPRSQMLLDALLRGGEQCSATELARRVNARSQAAIAAALDDLKKDLVITGVKAPNSSEVLHSITDRVFAHYYRKRILTHGEDFCPLEGLVDLLAVMYSPDEKRREAEKLTASGRIREAEIMRRLWQADKATTDINLGVSISDSGISNYLAEWNRLTNESKFSSAITVLRQAIKIAQADQHLDMESLLLRHLAWTFAEMERFDDVLILAKEAAEKAARAGTTMVQANSLRGVWLAEKRLKNDAGAIEAARKALQIARDHGHSYEELHSLVHLGQTYYNIKNNSAADEFLHDAILIEGQQPDYDIDDRLNLYSLYSSNLFLLEDYKKAIEVAKKAVNLTKGTQRSDDQILFLVTLGSCYARLKDEIRAMDAFERAIREVERQHSDQEMKNLVAGSMLVCRIGTEKTLAFDAYKLLLTASKNKRVNKSGHHFDDIAWVATAQKKWPILLAALKNAPSGSISVLDSAPTLFLPGVFVVDELNEGNRHEAVAKFRHFATAILFEIRSSEGATKKLFEKILHSATSAILLSSDDSKFLEEIKDILSAGEDSAVVKLFMAAIMYHRANRDASKLARIDPDFAKVLISLFPPPERANEKPRLSGGRKKRSTAKNTR